MAKVKTVKAAKGYAITIGTQAAEKHPNWNGGIHIDSGYVCVLIPSADPFHSMCDSAGYVRQHRLVMARHLGRPLLPQEVVHHENGDTRDNRLINLKLHASHSEHMKEHATAERQRAMQKRATEVRNQKKAALVAEKIAKEMK